MKFAIAGVGAWGKGFTSWEQLQSLLRGEQPADDPSSAKGPKPTLIPANERRRAPLTARLAVETSHQAVLAAGVDAQTLSCVFGSGYGDTAVTDYLCRALNTDDKQLSPTKFHNSVHNAPAGYWTISTGCCRPANSIAALEYTAGMTLLEAVSQCYSEQEPVLLTLFDVPVAPTLMAMFSCDAIFGLSMVLAPVVDVDQGGYSLRIIDAGQQQADQTHGLQGGLRQHYESNPSAKLLPLLQCHREGSTMAEILVPISAHRALAISGNNQ